jgi:hypothetical protein
MANMRYRKPSVKSLLGITKMKKRVKKALGINKVLAPFRAVNNYQRRMLRRAGYYSPEMKMMRAAKRGQAPGPIGPIQIGDDDSDEKGANSSGLLMAAMLAKGDQKDKGQHDDNALLMAAMLAQGMGDKEGEAGHKQGKKGGPNLAEAMILASALKNEEKTPASHARQANDAPAGKAKPANKGGAASSRARHAKDKSSEELPAPKRRRGFRLFGLFVMALVETAAIVAVWYYWII